MDWNVRLISASLTAPTESSNRRRRASGSPPANELLTALSGRRFSSKKNQNECVVHYNSEPFWVDRLFTLHPGRNEKLAWNGYICKFISSIFAWRVFEEKVGDVRPLSRQKPTDFKPDRFTDFTFTLLTWKPSVLTRPPDIFQTSSPQQNRVILMKQCWNVPNLKAWPDAL